MQCLGHDNHVEAITGEVAEALVEVLLDDVDTFLDAGGNVVRVDFQAIAADLLVVPKPGQQVTVTAAQVEHAAPRRDPVLDDVQVGAHMGSLYGDAVHVTAKGL